MTINTTIHYIHYSRRVIEMDGLFLPTIIEMLNKAGGRFSAFNTTKIFLIKQVLFLFPPIQHMFSFCNKTCHGIDDIVSLTDRCSEA